ncbi:MAG: restriction endonuclease subunit S [Prevotella sp.]|nr:restriction endonuclease subunit S [Prevotella sp.]
MEYQELKECAKYSNLRTSTFTKDTYISTENMLPNKGGVTSIDSIPTCKTTAKYESSDILISNIRPYFCKIWFATREGGCSNDVLVIKAKKTIEPKFLYYVLSDKNFFNYDTITSKGTKMPRGNKNAIMKYLVPKFSPLTQQKISSILSAYDRLIENNTRRIRLLEQMAENLYKEWFVRFRFPEHEKVEMVKSKYGRIPSNFNIIQMQDVFDYYVGGGWGEENMSNDFSEEASVIRGADFPKVCQYDISTCPRRFHKKSNYRSRQLEDGDIVMEISGGTSEQPVGRTILVTQSLIDRFDNGKVICASFCKLIRLRKNVISPFFFYYWMKFLYDTRIINRFQLQSTGIINFKFEPFLRKGDVMLPPTNVMNSFESHVVPIHKEMNKLAQQNQLLTRQRDLLLPRLMSGKLEVKS